jgi:SAM-dependent methyltransferase
MDKDKLKYLWKKEEPNEFIGWDFSHIKNRYCSEELPWDYKSIVKSYLKENMSLLDMGTGDGKFLLSLNHPYKKTSVTEKYEPNYKLCTKELEPLGIEVNRVISDTDLPFDNNKFDLVINRHESFDVSEVKRILKPDGVFITQQVGGRNNICLSKALIKDYKPQFLNNELQIVKEDVAKNGFKVIYSNEFLPQLKFFDIGAVIYFASIIKWEFPNFSVDNNFDELYALSETLDKKGFIESREHRFIIVAKLNKN